MRNKFFKQYGPTLVGIVVGMVGGFLYWRYVGCASGTCPITSSPTVSTLWGGVMGGLLFSIFRSPRDKE